MTKMKMMMMMMMMMIIIIIIIIIIIGRRAPDPSRVGPWERWKGDDDHYY